MDKTNIDYHDKNNLILEIILQEIPKWSAEISF